jgi:ABC-type ATPase with predicted acetyltransferase domain
LIDAGIASTSRVYDYLQEAIQIRQQTRERKSARLNTDKVEQLIDALSAEILEQQPRQKHYFAGILSAEGMIHYIDELSAGCRKRYLIKGPSGSGKSSVISKLAQRAQAQGYDLEYYHCGLEPGAIEMLIIRNLQVALIEAGEQEISLQARDCVVDMTICVDDGATEEIRLQSNDSVRRSETLLLQAQQEMEALINGTRSMKKIYASVMDFQRLDAKVREIVLAFSDPGR